MVGHNRGDIEHVMVYEHFLIASPMSANCILWFRDNSCKLLAVNVN